MMGLMSSSRVRVATYNVYLGADLALVFAVESPEHLATQATRVRDQVLATDFPARADAIAALLVRERVDVVGLQEVAEWSRATVEADGTPGDPEVWLDFLDELLAALQRAGTAYDAYASTANFAGGARVGDAELMSVLGHNVILVRRGSGVEVSEERTGDFAAMLEIPTRMADLVLQVRRSWGWIDARAGGERFRFVNTHTEAYDEDTRNAQRDELLAALGDPGIPVVLVGDFNAGPERVGMAEEYVDAWLAGGGPGDGHTCGQAADLANPDSALGIRIDYVWVRGAAVEGCWVRGADEIDRAATGLWPSDHACVVADLDVAAR
jgi:endonuclease/exonuclease/phosphatase family metal-dependent hydrolase